MQATQVEKLFLADPSPGRPELSVLMPVYNGERYLQESLDSILGQTFQEFEFIVVDDGSTDDTWKILKSCQARDARLSLFRNTQNRGLIATLNRGIALARGRYIARQDADDVSLPQRLENQLHYLRSHPEVGLLGTGYYRLTPQGKSLRQPPVTDTAIRWRFLFGNIWCHSSVVFKRSLVKDEDPVYRNFLHAEDYELWARLLEKTRGATLPIPLVIYRVHDENVCTSNPDSQRETTLTISAQQINKIAAHPVDRTQVAALQRCRGGVLRLRRRDLPLCRFIFELLEKFEQQPGVDARVVQRIRRNWIRQTVAALPVECWKALLESDLLAAMFRCNAAAVLSGAVVGKPRRALGRFRRRT